MTKAKSLAETPAETEEVVFVIKVTGQGGLLKYTKSRYDKFEKNIKASGYRIASRNEIEKYYDVHPDQKAEPNEHQQPIAKEEDEEIVPGRELDISDQ